MSTGIGRRAIVDREGTAGGSVHWNLSRAALVRSTRCGRGEGTIAADGALVCRTGPHTGRSPNDKFIVRDAASRAEVAWGSVNQPMEPEAFQRLRADLHASLEVRELFVQDC